MTAVRTSRILTSALVFASVFSAAQADSKGAGQAPRAKSASGHHEDHHGAMSSWFTSASFGKLATKRHGKMFLSGEPTAADVGALKTAGFTAIIDIRQENESREALKKAATTAGIAYINQPLFLADGSIDAKAVDAITMLHKKHHEAPHLIACKSGNRSSAWFAAHVASDHGLPVEKAIEAGRQAFLRDDMAQAVRTFAAKLPAPTR